MRSIAAMLTFLALLAPRIAHAQGQTCVLLPQPESSTAPFEAHERVANTITEQLRAHGLVVMPSRDAQLRMADQPIESCAAIDCAPDVNRFLGTAFAVLTELTWLRGRPTAINIVLIGVDAGASAGGQAMIERGGDLSTAVRSAFSSAWDRWQADSQGQLVIDSTPTGAFISIDGTNVGRAPLRQLVTAGVHTVVATLEGRPAQTREVTLDRHEERPLTFELAAPAAVVETLEAPAPIERWEDRPHWANWAIGGAALAIAIGLAVDPIWTAATAGTVYDRGAAGTDTVSFGPTSAALAIVSGAALIAGVVVVVVQPITEHVRVVVTTGGLRVDGAF